MYCSPWADILHPFALTATDVLPSPPVVLNGLELVKPCPARTQCNLFLGLIVYLLHCFAWLKLDSLSTLALNSRLRNLSLLTIDSIWSIQMSCSNWPTFRLYTSTISPDQTDGCHMETHGREVHILLNLIQWVPRPFSVASPYTSKKLNIVTI